MKAIEVTTSTKIHHAELGAEVWEWGSDEQAEFLVGFATTFASAGGHGIMQIHHIAAELRKDRNDRDVVRWLNDRLTEYLADDERL